MSIHAVFARLLSRRLASAGPVIASDCPPTSKTVSGPATTAGTPPKPNGAAQRKRVWALRVEREILIAEIKQARRLHKQASTLEAELRAVTTELLSIG